MEKHIEASKQLKNDCSVHQAQATAHQNTVLGAVQKPWNITLTRATPCIFLAGPVLVRESFCESGEGVRLPRERG